MSLLPLALGLGVLALAAAVRIVYVHSAGAGFGGDRWYWRAYVEEVRTQRRFPPRLERYLLDDGHWYPPLFPLLLCALPRAAFDRGERWLALAIDLGRMALLMAVAWFMGTGGVAGMLAAGLAYAATPIVIGYNAQLNPRGLAALLLDALALALIAGGGASPGLVIAVSVLGGAILLTHKMTTQLLVFLSVAGSLLAWDPRLLLIPIAAVAVAFLASGGFYARVLRAHADIVAFWDRNWPWLFCHPIRDSPVYARGEPPSPTALHRDDLGGVARRLASLAGFAPAAWVALALALLERDRLDAAGLAVAQWAAATAAFALLTTFVPSLRCLGAGYLYTFNLAFPGALLVGLLVRGSAGPLPWGGWLAGMALSVVAVYHSLSKTRARGGDDDPGRDEVIDFLRGAPRGPVLCLPNRLADTVAYLTPQPVLWGGHGYGFRRIEPLFPRLLVSLREVAERYSVRYLVLEDDLLPERFEAEVRALGETRRFGRYRLTIVGNHP